MFHCFRTEKSFKKVGLVHRYDMVQNKPLSEFALLTRREKDWVLGNITVSKDVQRDIRYRIRRKLEILCSEELPLLVDKGFVVNIANVLCQLGKFVFNGKAYIINNIQRGL
jgi:hypothetical protein